MFPLKVILVGVGDTLLTDVRRELSNMPAEVEAEFRTARHCLDSLRTARADTRLVITHVRSSEDVQELNRMSGVFVNWPVLALVDGSHDTGLLLRANRAGAWQVVPLPLHAGDFHEAVSRLGLQFGYSTTNPRVFAVSGSAGGCGTTSVAINVAHEIAFRHKLHSVLVELALQMGVLGTYLDVEPRGTVPDLLLDVKRLDVYLIQQALTNVAEKFDILAGPQQVLAPVQAAPRDLLQLVEYTRRLANVVMLDVPCTFNELQFEMLANADRVLLVGAQTIPSVRSLKLVRDLFSREHAASSLVVVINRYDPSVEGFTADDLKKLLDVPTVVTVADDTANFNAALNQGRPLRLVAPQSPALADIGRLASTLLGVAVEPEPKPAGSGLFARLRRAFK